MADIVSPVTRSRMMSRIKSKNTKPESAVRKGLFSLGYRYRLNSKLPGKPDIVLPKYKAIIFVHGCFWHGHDCPAFKWPKTRPQFWRAKIEGNKARDVQVVAKLEKDGWRTTTVWECAIRKNIDAVISQLDNWLQIGVVSKA